VCQHLPKKLAVLAYYNGKGKNESACAQQSADLLKKIRLMGTESCSEVINFNFKTLI